jgi:Sec-independent protein translocase protein TatA
MPRRLEHLVVVVLVLLVLGSLLGLMSQMGLMLPEMKRNKYL